MSTRQIKWVFLVFDEFVYGREMLAALLNRGFIPDAIIQEKSKLAIKTAKEYNRYTSGMDVNSPLIKEQIKEYNIKNYNVKNHNNEESSNILKSANPDMIILGGTRIIKQHILDIPKQGTINVHPGLLPEVRGLSCIMWPLYKNLEIGATAFLVDAGIDTGDIIVKRKLQIFRGDTLQKIYLRMMKLSSQLTVESLELFVNCNANPVAQDLNQGEYYSVIPDELYHKAVSNLENGTYHHYSD